MGPTRHAGAVEQAGQKPRSAPLDTAKEPRKTRFERCGGQCRLQYSRYVGLVHVGVIVPPDAVTQLQLRELDASV
jgi:hypothetical protein